MDDKQPTKKKRGFGCFTCCAANPKPEKPKALPPVVVQQRKQEEKKREPCPQP